MNDLGIRNTLQIAQASSAAEKSVILLRHMNLAVIIVYFAVPAFKIKEAQSFLSVGILYTLSVFYCGLFSDIYLCIQPDGYFYSERIPGGWYKRQWLVPDCTHHYTSPHLIAHFSAPYFFLFTYRRRRFSEIKNEQPLCFIPL